MEPAWQLLTLEIIDYLVQTVMLLLGFVYPWFVPRGHGKRVFAYPLFLSFLWCLWRLALFDRAINNDVPGIAYLFAGFMVGLIGWALYGLRCFVFRHNPAADEKVPG